MKNILKTAFPLLLLAALLLPQKASAACIDPNCSFHGRCEMNTCMCNSGWTGTTCNQASYCGSLSCLNCSGHGSCNGYGSLGSCACASGWVGQCCQMPDPMLKFTSQAMLVPAALDFGAQPVGAGSQPQTVTFTMLTMPGFIINSISVTGSNPADFTLGGSCAVGQTFTKGGGVCSITVSFTPGAPGLRSGQLSIDGTPSPGLQPVALGGSGILPSGSIVSDPAISGRVYAALDGTGIFSSSDSGQHWSAAASQPTNRHVRGVVLKPGDSTKLYAATYGSGVFKSVNSGADWLPCANTNLANLNLLSLKIDPAGKLFAGSEAGMFVSADGCASWLPMNVGMP